MKYLREWKIEDAEDVAKVLNNKKVLDNLRDGLPFPYKKEDGEFYINSVLNAEKDSQYAWVIHLDGKVIGSVGIFRQGNIHFRTGEIGYYIGEDYWGKGIMTNAVKEACGFVFENTDIVRIFAEPFATNIGSCRVLEKSGFQLEGVLRQNAFKNGEMLDMKMYSKIK